MLVEEIQEKFGYKENNSYMWGIGVSATFKDVTICLWKNKECVDYKILSSLFLQRHLLLEVEALLKAYHLAFKDVNYIVLDTGPGSSFTGLRISLAIFKAFYMVYPVLFYKIRSTLLLYDEFILKNPNLLQAKVLVGFFGFQNRAYIETFYNGFSFLPVEDKDINTISDYINQNKVSMILGDISEKIILNPSIKISSLKFPDIRYARSYTPVTWEDLKPEYYRKTQAEEKLL